MQIVQSIIVMFRCIKQTTEFSVCGPSVYHHLHGNPNAMATESHGHCSHGGPYFKNTALHRKHKQTYHKNSSSDAPDRHLKKNP